MSRKVTLAPHLTLRQIQEKYYNSQDRVESRRWHVLWKVGLGWTIKNSAIAVGLSYEYARRVVKRYNDKGEATVINQHNKNRSASRVKRPQNALLNGAKIEAIVAD